MDFDNFDQYSEIQKSLNALYSKITSDDLESPINNRILESLNKAGFVNIYENGNEINPLNILSLVFKQAGYHGLNLDLFSFFIDVPLIFQSTKSSNSSHLSDHLSLNKIIATALKEPYSHVEEGFYTFGIEIPNGYSITGLKHFIENYNESDSILISFQTHQGVKIALINKDLLIHEDQVITTGKSVTQITFKNLEIPFENIIETNDVLELLNEIDLTQKLMRSMFIEGVTKKMMELTSAYTAERKQFDKPIATFQAVSHRAASMFIDQECLSLVNQQALYALSMKTNNKENYVLTAKAWAADVSHRSSYSAQHLHGGIGVSKEYNLWKYCLLAKEHEIIHDSAGVCLNKIGKNITLNQ